MSEKKERFGQRAGKFFKEVRLEMKKVIWPTKQQLINNTLTVFVACLFIGGIIWIADAGLGLIFKAVFGQ
ncbi:MAG: preprotein translocase subunit SecE [Clostridiaceae bacterium]|jgi:preprotein translocase subunit SecE|nr:preprotein translocase subunit SecE [Clostridiaceae bacterium]